MLVNFIMKCHLALKAFPSWKILQKLYNVNFEILILSISSWEKLPVSFAFEAISTNEYPFSFSFWFRFFIGIYAPWLGVAFQASGKHQRALPPPWWSNNRGYQRSSSYNFSIVTFTQLSSPLCWHPNQPQLEKFN